MTYQDPMRPAADPAPGEAELQTDVMRFFALLAICLLALMSIARQPAPPQAAGPAAAPPPPAAEAKTEAARRPAPAPVPLPPAPPEPAPAPEPTASPAADPPLSLRFATAEALMRLEAAGDVRIFVASDAQGFLWSGRQRRFVEAPLPSALYLMDPATIPESLSGGLQRAGVDPAEARWGVTLSPPIRRRLSAALTEDARGLWLIDAAGRVVPSEGS